MLRLLLSFALLVVYSSCGGSADRPTSPIRGLLSELHSAESGQLDSFALKADDGKTWQFKFEPEPGAAVPVRHLQLHVDQHLPVKVSFYSGRPTLIAFRIDDG